MSLPNALKNSIILHLVKRIYCRLVWQVMNVASASCMENAIVWALMRSIFQFSNAFYESKLSFLQSLEEN